MPSIYSSFLIKLVLCSAESELFSLLVTLLTSLSALAVCELPPLLPLL